MEAPNVAVVIGKMFSWKHKDPEKKMNLAKQHLETRPTDEWPLVLKCAKKQKNTQVVIFVEKMMEILNLSYIGAGIDVGSSIETINLEILSLFLD